PAARAAQACEASSFAAISAGSAGRLRVFAERRAQRIDLLPEAAVEPGGAGPGLEFLEERGAGPRVDAVREHQALLEARPVVGGVAGRPLEDVPVHLEGLLFMALGLDRLREFVAGLQAAVEHRTLDGLD